MAALYKLLFDLAAYYSLTGFYLYVFAGVGPSLIGFGLLALLAGGAVWLQRREEAGSSLRLPLLLLPAVTFFFRPGLWPALQLLPAWAYLGYTVYTGRTAVEEESFRGHFGFALRLLLLWLPAFVFSRRSVGALSASVPYVTVLLSTGVCLLRMLREKTGSGRRQAVYMAVFVLCCVLLTLGRAPQAVGLALKYLYQYVLAPALLIGLVGAGYLVYLLFKGFFYLVQLLTHGEAEPVQMDLRSAAESMGLEDTYEFVEKDHPVARIIGYVLLTAAVLAALFFIFRRLLGDRAKEAADARPDERRAAAPAPERRKKPGLTRPRDPRLAVRFYYARFLRECRRRAVTLRPGMTSLELAEACRGAFPGVDTGVLQQLYLPARYSDREPVTQNDANRAAQAWKELKHSRMPEL